MLKYHIETTLDRIQLSPIPPKLIDSTSPYRVKFLQLRTCNRKEFILLTFLKSGNSLPFVPNTQGTLAVLSALHTEDFHPSEKEREKNIFLIINNVSKRLMTCYDIKQIICMILPNARQINRCFFSQFCPPVTNPLQFEAKTKRI